MIRKLYPIGIQTFERIRKEDKLYIDKTMYVYRMTHTDGTYFFLGRPRRFGKSLLVSTFDSYFSGKKQLFEGLAIEKMETEWTQYPVIRLDMSGGKHMEKDELVDYLCDMLEEQEDLLGVTGKDKAPNLRFKDLILQLYKKTGKQVVVLIDEYDAPLLDVARDQGKLDELRNVMRKFNVVPTDLRTTYGRSTAFDAPTENMKTLTPLLYQSGYITIKGYDPLSQLYTLDIPNKEIKVGLFESLLPNYLEGQYAENGDVAIARMSVLINRRDMDGALRLLQTFLGTVPYCDNTHYEGHYQQMLYIIFTLLTNFVVDVEVHTPKGRVDIVLLTQTDLYVMELKLGKSADTAMRQIELNEYNERFALSGKPVTNVGINFDSEKGNIEDWIVK